MRIEGYVPVRKATGNPVWGWSGPTEEYVYALIESVWRQCVTNWEQKVREEFEVVRVGDVDTIRDEALAEAENAICEKCRVPCCERDDPCMAVEAIRAKRAKS